MEVKFTLVRTRRVPVPQSLGIKSPLRCVSVISPNLFVDACRPMRMPVLDMFNIPADTGRLQRAEKWQTPFEQKIKMP